ncbi:hypothetical protein ACIQOU_04200 [Streptomyces sp. NPDC091279]|uniref:hypothetical protein n=1 Tax=unclassified Streptomyces TaxID=2593676 RepID=UPI003828C026
MSITLTTFHFSSVLTLGVTVATARWPHSLPAQVLVTILASALSDRSRVVRLKLRRTR